MEWMRIGEVARRTGLTTRTLRHYDELGLLVPSGRTDTDYRMYTLEDVQRLLAIQHLKSLGFGLAEIAAALDDPGFDPSATLRRHIEAVEDRIAAEQDLLRRLTSLVAAPHEDWDDVLAAIALSERLRHPEPAVRFRATLDAPADIPTPDLIELLRGDPEPGVREVASWALVQRGPEAFDAVAAHLADPDAAVRRQMAHVLGKLADPRGVDTLAALLTDPAPEVAAKAAFALGQLGGPGAVAALAGALGHGTATQRATVVTALGRLGPLRASRPVAPRPAPAVAEVRGGEGVRAEGARGEGARGEGTRGVGARGVGARGEGTRGEGARGEGARGEGARGEGARGEGTPWGAGAARGDGRSPGVDPEPTPRRPGNKTIPMALRSDAARAAVAVLASADPAARADAAETLGLLDDPAALDVLAVAASDPVEEVRLAALMALASLPGAAPTLAAQSGAEGRTGMLARALAARTR